METTAIPKCSPYKKSWSQIEFTFVALCGATNGANCTHTADRQSELQFSDWYGVTPDENGHVTGLPYILALWELKRAKRGTEFLRKSG